METPEVGPVAWIPVAILVLVFACVLWRMYASWHKRSDGERAEATLPGLSEVMSRTVSSPATGKQVGRGEYIATTYADKPLERVHAYGLGMRSPLVLSEVYDEVTGLYALDLTRSGSSSAGSFLIPRSDLADVFLAPGIAGKWMGTESVIILRWRVGDILLDTGVLLTTHDMREQALALAPNHSSSLFKETS